MKQERKFPPHVQKILEDRYFLSGELYKKYYGIEGKENWESLCLRVVKTITQDSELQVAYYEMMHELDFLPNSPTLFGAGLPGLCLSACFIIPVEDSIEGWMDSYKIATKVQTHGGGCGFPLHKIRPAGIQITGKRAKAAGPIAFMKNWNAISKSFSQGPRSGANMGQMRCLRGDTKIHTLHGKVAIKDLVGKTPYLYCIDEVTKEPHIEKCVEIFISDTNRKLFRVHFDNDEFIDCTGDHRFLLSESSGYKEASELQKGDSLVAFHKIMIQHGSNSRFDYQIGFTGGNSLRQYRVVAQDILNEITGKDWHPHHKDGNSLNDDPSNLQMVNRSDHASEHLQNVKILQQKTAEKRRGRKLEDVYPPEVVAVWKQRMSDAAKRRIAKKKLENHKVVRVEYLGIVNEDVYDIRMPKHHNFVANEVVVHNCDHPDIEEFIVSKSKDGELSAFNISVMITDEFMKAVEDNEMFELKWNGKISRVIPAIDLWEKIMKCAWETGEPGILFWDNIQRAKHPKIGGDLYGNPCLHGDTEILTKEYGLVKIRSLVGREFHTFDYNKNPQFVKKVWKSGEKECVKVTLDSGLELICTPDHRWMLDNGLYCESKDLLGKQLLYRQIQHDSGIIPKNYRNHDFRCLGFIFGDGSYHKASERVKYFYIGSKDNDVLEYFKESSDCKNFEYTLDYRGTSIIKKGYCDDFFTETLPTRHLPRFIKWLPVEKQRDFLCGLFSANGFVINDKKKNQRLVLKMTNKDLLKDIQKILLTMGIFSNLTSEKGHNVEFENGAYFCKTNFQLKIMDKESLIKFKNTIGFIQVYKNIKLEEMISYVSEKKAKNKLRYNQVVSVESCGKHEVFDFTQDSTHCGNVYGFITHNCAEFNGPEGAACNLGSINVSNCANSNGFDFEKLRKLTRLAYLFLNDVIDANHYPDPKIADVVHSYRQIGVGVMGLHDTFLKYGMMYGDEDSCALTNEIFACIKEELKKVNEEHNHQNTMMMSIAPTGTISMIAQCSSGIEPQFSFEPIKRLINGKEEIYEVFKSDNPKINLCGKDLPIDAHLNIVSIAQKHVDMSISKTIILPKNCSVQDVKDAYHRSWKLGLKGVTVYRDESRANQPIQTKNSYSGKKPLVHSEIDSIRPIKREGILDGKTYKDKIGCGNLYITISHDHNGNIIEIFIRPGSRGGCESNVQALGRMVSLGLRCGIKVEAIVKQLKGIRCPNCVNRKPEIRYLSCADAIGRAIENSYVILKNPELDKKIEVKVGDCPECKKEKLIHEGGCVRCICGYSKCG